MGSDPATLCDFDSGKMVVRLKVMLAADKNAVDPVVQNVMQIVKEIDCAAGKEEAVELALTEALANAVLHGAKADVTKIVECDVACDDHGTMLIIVRDPGNGFDPAVIPSPISGQNLYSNCGRGIYLINQLMDEVKFAKNGSEIQMIKR
ncbi:MAG: ATP-binding protein [Acidobacteriaceae bacterium]